MPLQVFVDGKALPEPEARELWARFSAYMDEHRGDLAGFARAEGLGSIHPEMRDGAAALVASRTSSATQRAYTTAANVTTRGQPNPPRPPQQQHHHKPPRRPGETVAQQNSAGSARVNAKPGRESTTRSGSPSPQVSRGDGSPGGSSGRSRPKR